MLGKRWQHDRTQHSGPCEDWEGAVVSFAHQSVSVLGSFLNASLCIESCVQKRQPSGCLPSALAAAEQVRDGSGSTTSHPEHLPRLPTFRERQRVIRGHVILRRRGCKFSQLVTLDRLRFQSLKSSSSQVYGSVRGSARARAVLYRSPSTGPAPAT